MGVDESSTYQLGIATVGTSLPDIGRHGFDPGLVTL